MNREPRSLPYNEDAEKGLLCSMILSPDVLLDCASQLATELFYAPAHRIIFLALCDLSDRGRPVDFLTLKHQLAQNKQLAEVGGPEFLNALLSFVPTAANWRYYLELVIDYYHRRIAIVECQRLIERMYDINEAAAETVGSMVEKILIHLALGIGRVQRTFRELVKETLERIDERAKADNEALSPAIRFDLSTLDNELGGGIHPGELCVISADTNIGKSALSLHPILWTARSKKSVALFSFEMPGTQIVERTLAHEGDISLRTIRSGKFLDAELERLHASAKQISNYAIFIEEAGYDINQVVSRCRYLVLRHNIALVVVDYLQLVEPALARRESTREREVADISRKLKRLALELKIPVIAVSQLNEQGRLAQSRAIGHDADIVLKLEESDSENAFALDVLIAKHRSGARNKRVTLEFFGEYMQFRIT